MIRRNRRNSRRFDVRGRNCRRKSRREWLRALLRRVILQRPYVEVLRCLAKAFPVQLNPLVLNLPVPAFLLENIVGNYTGLEGGNVCDILNDEFPSIRNTFALGNNQDGPLTKDINIIIPSDNEFRSLRSNCLSSLFVLRNVRSRGIPIIRKKPSDRGLIKHTKMQPSDGRMSKIRAGWCRKLSRL